PAPTLGPLKAKAQPRLTPQNRRRRGRARPARPRSSRAPSSRLWQTLEATQSAHLFAARSPPESAKSDSLHRDGLQRSRTLLLSSPVPDSPSPSARNTPAR